MDILFSNLQKNEEISRKKVEQLRKFVFTEQYDTESMSMDVLPTADGNICEEKYGPILINDLSQFLYMKKCMYSPGLFQTASHQQN